MLRFPLQLPPVVKPRKRHIFRTYFFGGLGVLLGLLLLIFLFGLYGALNQ